MNLDHTRDFCPSVLNSIASEGASILTINQTIPINNIANVTVTIETNEMQGELGKIDDTHGGLGRGTVPANRCRNDCGEQKVRRKQKKKEKINKKYSNSNRRGMKT